MENINKNDLEALPVATTILNRSNDKIWCDNLDNIENNEHELYSELSDNGRIQMLEFSNFLNQSENKAYLYVLEQEKKNPKRKIKQSELIKLLLTDVKNEITKKEKNQSLPDYVNNSVMNRMGNVVLTMIGVVAATANYTLNQTESAKVILSAALGFAISSIVLSAKEYDNKTK